MADIELVIKIPEEEYEICLSHRESIENMIRVHKCFSLEYAVIRGTPLPKGHKRLIEDNFKVGPVFDKEGNRVGYQYVTQEDLDNAQTIIEADAPKRRKGTPLEENDSGYNCENWIP